MVKMGTVEDHTQAKGAHKLTLSNRRTAGITGVSDVISFDISEVLLETDMGMPGCRPSCESAEAGKWRDRSGGKDRQHPVFGSVRLQKRRRDIIEPSVPVSLWGVTELSESCSFLDWLCCEVR